VFLAVELEKVYLSNLPEYGRLVYLYKDIPNIWLRNFEGQLLDLFKRNNFDPGVDFFAVSGIMPLACVGVAVLVEEYGNIQLLLWDKKFYEYRMKLIGG